MLEDQIQLSLISLFVVLGAAVSVRLWSQKFLAGRYLLSVAIGSLGVAVGVFITTFVVSGYGWGWPDLSRSRELLFLVAWGLCVGFIHAAFAWILSRRLSVIIAAALLLGNVGVALIPAEYAVSRMAAFALGNFLLLSVWLSKVEPRQAVPS